MRVLKCTKCKRPQSSGKFCLDCGAPLGVEVTAGIKFKPINTGRSSDQLKKDIRNWLTRIGVQNQDIQIAVGNTGAEVTYLLLGKRYVFKSFLQTKSTDNLAAVEQFLHYRVIGIERGIETAEQAFAAYTALPAPKTLQDYSYSELRELLKKHHPDTGDGNVELLQQVTAELDRRNA